MVTGKDAENMNFNSVTNFKEDSSALFKARHVIVNTGLFLWAFCERVLLS